MNLGELIEFLKKQPHDLVVPHGFSGPHSFRGFYEQLAFEPTDNVTVGSMLACAESAMGATFDGYKGGEYRMNEFTDVWLCEYGTSCGAIPLSILAVEQMTNPLHVFANDLLLAAAAAVEVMEDGPVKSHLVEQISKSKGE